MPQQTVATVMEEKWHKAIAGTVYEELAPADRTWIRHTAFDLRCTFQEIRELITAARDLAMWRETPLHRIGPQLLPTGGDPRRKKERFFQALRAHLHHLKNTPPAYPSEHPLQSAQRPVRKIRVEATDRKIHGLCPVASDKTVCCNLRTIDAVQNCAFGCSYCTIQTFFGDAAIIEADLARKLETIEIDPNRYVHFTTGQSSDSLVWGNRAGMLDALCAFARVHPNILLEFKTKSSNIRYFLDHDIPPNIVCAWSLNTGPVVRNEEHFTASLEQRLQAARTVADRGVFVAFHFHPMVRYAGWNRDYPALARRLMDMFDPEEVLFVSMGSVTLIKPVIREIRRRGGETKILQTELVPDPHGKWTYPDEVKIRMFRTMYAAFQPWHDRVYFYLCMEKAAIWDAVFGWHYPTNDAFEADFGRHVMSRIRARTRSR